MYVMLESLRVRDIIILTQNMIMEYQRHSIMRIHRSKKLMLESESTGMYVMLRVGMMS